MLCVRMRSVKRSRLKADKQHFTYVLDDRFKIHLVTCNYAFPRRAWERDYYLSVIVWTQEIYSLNNQERLLVLLEQTMDFQSIVVELSKK